MVPLITRFASCCRSAGLGVSTSEVLDCLCQLDRIDLSGEKAFRTVLRSNFAKSRREQETFDRLYHLFFHDMHADPPGIAKIDPKQQREQEDLLKNLASDHDDPVYQAIMEMMAGNPQALLEQVQEIHTGKPAEGSPLKSNMAAVSKRMEILLQLNRASANLERRAAESGFSPRGAARLKNRLGAARRILSEEPRPHNPGMIKRTAEPQESERGLGTRPFSSLTPGETAEMRQSIGRLVRKLKDIVSRRQNARRRGVIDIKKTLRSAAAYQGVPLEICYRKKAPRKAKIVTLCDISGSVWSASRFMLGLLYSLQDCFSRVHSYVFVSDLMEVTATFEKYDIDTAIGRVLDAPAIACDAPTDYGGTFEAFKSGHFSVLSPKTTLIIMGDGRSNYLDPRAATLDEIRHKCRRIIWLNPEPERFWGTGDSEMRTYQAYCHEVRSCRNLNQLTEFIEDLVL